MKIWFNWYFRFLYKFLGISRSNDIDNNDENNYYCHHISGVVRYLEGIYLK